LYWAAKQSNYGDEDDAEIEWQLVAAIQIFKARWMMVVKLKDARALVY
jgi:hypothetical protein